jgi:exopolysaccharide biosynthesis polyprenyl glycosylphosphotransferase
MTTTAVVSSQSTSQILRPNHRAERRSFAERLSYITFLGDTVVAVLMLFLSYGLRFHTKLSSLASFDEAVNLRGYLPHICFGVVLLLVLLWNQRAYLLARILSYTDGAVVVAKVSVLWLAAYYMLSFMFKISPGISRLFCLIAAVQILVGLLSWRLLLSKFLQKESLMQRLRGRLLFIGWNEECHKIADMLNHTAGHPYELIGVVPPTTGLPESAGSMNTLSADSISELRQIIEREEIDVIMATDSGLPMSDLPTLADICVRELVELKIVPSYFQIFLSGLQLESMSGAPVLGISALPLQRQINSFFKRLVDIFGALVGLALSAPIMLLFGYLVKRESPGPMFYRQVRVGAGGKPFYIYKIRSMRLDSENDGKARWAQSGDNRCTKVGGLMRRWNVDEVPQFWNVLKGEMSLVGPRPERPEFIENFKESIPNYNARHRVKPGITGWAQVNGLRGNTDLTKRINHDLYYIENWNLLLDFQIMAMTFMNRDNAY